MKTLSKKGFTLVEVPSLLVVLVVIAIVLGVGASILTNMQSDTAMSTTSTRFYGNSTFTAINATAVDFTPSALIVDGSGKAFLVTASCSGIKVSNNTNVDKTTDFTVSGCTALLKDNSQNNTNHKANFTYTYNIYYSGYNITQEGLDGQISLSGWQSTWVVIVAAAVVIGIVGRYLFFKT